MNSNIPDLKLFPEFHALLFWVGLMNPQCARHLEARWRCRLSGPTPARPNWNLHFTKFPTVKLFFSPVSSSIWKEFSHTYPFDQIQL